MPQLDDLTDVCKDGNLLKVNSCNCAAELDEAKKVSARLPSSSEERNH